AEAGAVLPAGVAPHMAADATALGQIFWYTLDGGDLDPGRRWALQKFYVGPQLNGVPGVAEVAAVGGLPLEYQIDVDPNALRAYGVTLSELYDAVAQSNSAVGGQTIQQNNAEYLVRGVGWITDVKDIEDTVVTQRSGVPVYVKNLAAVQLGPQFRRSVLEKDGGEAVGGVVLMRYGENPLAVTERVKQKIQEIQGGLPKGVHVVPAYDRTRLIHGAISSLEEVMWHEMVIASIAVLLILMHFRSVFVICVTLPLAVLFAFLSMWLLRVLHILDVQANIMSLAGITISIGILVDQAIVMVENATHQLKEEFGDKKVIGDTREIVIRACKTVGRPIFFSVLIVLISFIPVFAMTGREGKLFHPMAITKSLAMVGVALISATVVPALIPAFIRGKLRREEDNWIVRSFVRVYKPLLSWALPRRNFVMWAFAVLLILAAGLFPLPAVLGLGASHYYWQIAFFVVFCATTTLTVIFTQGLRWQLLSLATLTLIGVLAFHFPQIGVEFMPDLNEGTLMDMPTSTTQVGAAEASDDLKARDALLREFPEVESVIGKAGRADTPTDPAPLNMVESFVNFRPKEWWPRRAMHFDDAVGQTRAVLAKLEEQGYVRRAGADERDGLINEAAMKALEKFDDAMRKETAERYRGFQTDLGPTLTRTAVAETVRRMDESGHLQWPAGTNDGAEIDALARDLTPTYGAWLAKYPALEDVTKLTDDVARRLADRGVLHGQPGDALALRENAFQTALDVAGEAAGLKPKTFNDVVLRATAHQRSVRWTEFVRDTVNGELVDRGAETFTWAALEEAAAAAESRRLLAGAPHGDACGRFADAAAQARQGKRPDESALAPIRALRAELEKPFARGLILWRRQDGLKGDLVQEMYTAIQVPGWANIPTQPIINRINMLATGVRTQIGVKVFGPDLKTIDEVCQQVKKAVESVPGADATAVPVTGKGYLEIKIDREKAARYGVRVGDIQDTIEIALGGRVATQTVEGRDRFPVRIRYARDFREDEEKVKRLLVSRGMAPRPAASIMPETAPPTTTTEPTESHMTAPEHAVGAAPLQIPLSEVADVRIVEGPAMITSENGRLANYVTVNLHGDRDVIGFVEEARRAVAERVPLPEGVHVEWSGEFENQVRAAQTLRVVLPAVAILIFLVLYLTYKDLTDAALMMLAVPEALAGGVFFQFLFPKIRALDWSAPPTDFSVAVWVGYIAAFGMATETGVIMLVYLRQAIDKRGGLEKISSLEELRQAVIEGAVHRLRPKLLTEGVAILALAPMLFASGVGSEVIASMALPVLGGLLIADEVVDIFLPVRFYWVRRARWLKIQARRGANAQAETAAPAALTAAPAKA
ncbi:MAG TPA: efflux RND transporter permease subunit, partial [Gemmataceae bacterium]|nr:efflux RND transporter permease subunit [Gemmataceae bacterium]